MNLSLSLSLSLSLTLFLLLSPDLSISLCVSLSLTLSLYIYILNEQFQRVTVYISAVSRLPFIVVIQVTLPTADLSSEQSRSTIQRKVQDMVGTRRS